VSSNSAICVSNKYLEFDAFFINSRKPKLFTGDSLKGCETFDYLRCTVFLNPRLPFLNPDSTSIRRTVTMKNCHTGMSQFPHTERETTRNNLFKDRDEVNRRGVSECDGRVCDFQVVYYESRKWDLKIRLLMNEGRCDERLKGRVEESTCLTYTGLHDKTN
jgi:hypothetical protein